MNHYAKLPRYFSRTRLKNQRTSALRRRLAVEALEQRAMLSGAPSPLASTTQHETLADLPAAAQQVVSSDIGQDQPAYHAVNAASGATLANAANGFSAQVQAGDLHVSVGSDTWDMALAGLSFGGAMQPTGTAQTSINGNRVDSNYQAVDEWFVNGPAGLEQGFTVPALTPSETTGSLTVELALGGDLVGTVNASGDGLTLARPDGSTALGYAGLTAYDASGKSLPASLEVLTVGGHQELLIHVNDAGAQGPITIDPIVQAAILTASDGAETDQLGDSVSISGNTLVVGAQYASINGQSIQGAAYVFIEPVSGWANMTETAKLTASDGASYNYFGSTVSISGNTIVVGATGATVGGNQDQGAVYVYTEPVSGWASMTETAKLTASDGVAGDWLGYSVSVSGDTVLAGAIYATIGSNGGQGAAYVYTEPVSGWANMTETAKLTASDGAVDDHFGISVSISGNTAVVGAESAKVGGNAYQGAAYVFSEPVSGWANSTETAKLTASNGAEYDNFGASVSISGNAVAVGALNANSDKGAAYVFTEPVSGWASMTQTAELTASDGATWDTFGNSVSISGDTVLVGAPNRTIGSNYYAQGAAYAFTEPVSGWANMTQTSELTASDGAEDDNFGDAVSVSGSELLVGAPNATVGSNVSQGKAYVFASSSPVTVTGVSTTEATGAYTAGTTIPITVTFSSAVTVDTTGGTPTLTLNDGAVATYVSGSGTSTLTFNYTVGSSDNEADLDYASTTALALNGGTVDDAGGDPATLTLPTTGTDGFATTNLVIDTTPPTSSVTSLPSLETSASFTVSWSGQDTGGSGIATYDVYFSDDGGPWTVFVGNTTQTSATFTGQSGHTYGFTSAATDNAGNLQLAPSVAEATTSVSGYEVGVDGNGNLTITDPSSTGETDALTFSFDGTSYTFSDNNSTFSYASTPLAGTTISTDGHTLTVDEAQASSFTGSKIILNLQAASATATLRVHPSNPWDKELIFEGGAGSNTLRVDLPFFSSLPAAGIDFMGDALAASNSLEINGAGQNETLTTNGSTADRGTIADSSGAIFFTNLQAADLHGLGTATVATSSGNQEVLLANGVDATLGGANPALRVNDTGTGTSFPAIALWDNTLVTINAANNSGYGGVTVDSADNASDNQSLAIQTAGGPGGIAIYGPLVVSGDVSLTAAGAIVAEVGSGSISAALLTTQSTDGTTLNGGNTVGSFNATNGTSGDIQFADTAAPLTITGISQTAGNVQVVNSGGTQITGTIDDTTPAGIVSLRDRTAGIQETGSGLVEADMLITQAKTGTLLNGANTVSNLLAVNDPSGGNFQLTNTAAPLSISGLIETGGNVTIVNAGGITIPGTIKDLAGTANLQDTTAGIQETGGQIMANSLVTQSQSGTILNGCNMVAAFQATNSASGNVQLGDTAAPLTISGISETGGNVQVVDFGGTQITGTIDDSAATGIVSLRDGTAGIQETGSGLVDANMLITQSKTGTLLNGANTVSDLLAVNDPSGGNFQLTNTAAPLTVSGLIETGGNVTVVNAGGISISGTIKDLAGTVNLHDTSAGIQETGGQIDANQLVTQSVDGTVLNGNNAISVFNAANAAGNDIDLNDNADALLTISGISQNSGNVQVVNFGGDTAGSGILITGLIDDNSGTSVSLKEWSADIEESGPGLIDAHSLVTQSKRGTLLGGANEVGGLYAVNDPDGGNFQLADNVADLYIARLIETGGNVNLRNLDGISLSSPTAITASGTVTLVD